METRGNEYLDQIEKRVSKRDVDFIRRCCHGRPHEEIIKYADSIDADMIVMGYQGKSHMESEILGSVSDRVIRNAGRAILIV